MPLKLTVIFKDGFRNEAYELVRSIPGKIRSTLEYVELEDTPKPKVEKAKMSDRRQIVIIWLLAIIVILAVFLYIEVSTRP